MNKPWIAHFATIDLKNVVIKIKDGTSPTPLEIEVGIGEGNLTFSEKQTREYLKDRGRLDEVRDGDEEPMDVRLDFKWDYLQGTSGSGGIPSIENAIKRTGAAAAWVSTDDDACRPYAVDLVLENVPVPSGCGDTETIVLPDFRWETLDHDLRGATVACSGRCNATRALVTRATPTT